MRGLTLVPLARRLQAQGFIPHRFDYASLLHGPAPSADRLAAKLMSLGPGPVHLVGHSLGGLIVLETLRRFPGLPVARVVCMGSPLRGSRTAQALAARPRLAWALGSSRALLQSGCTAWAGAVPVGMIAGDVAHGIGRVLGAIGAESDGTVALDETRLPGLAARCRVHASHTGLVFSARAAQQAAAFLHTGAFLGSDGAPDADATTGGPV